MDWNIFDVFGIPVQEIPENAILQWDWCKRVLVELPAETLTCDDIIDCVQWELDNIWAALNGKIGCTQVASCPVIIGLQDQINVLPNSILGDVKFYVNSLNDSVTTEVANWDTMSIYWLDGLRFLTNPISGVHELRLPSGANDRDVLVWRDSAGWAVWETISDCLCNQIATCPSITALENMYTALQNQINYLLWLDPSDQPVLTCSDVARCIWAGTTDVDHAMAQWIINWIEWDNLLASITAIENEVASIEIRTCANVMACAGISAMWTEISNLWIRVTDNEWNITSLETNYTTILWLVNNHEGRIAAIESDILTLQWQWASNVIRTCLDVMACPDIIALVNNVANLDGRVTAIENCCADITVNEWSTEITDSLSNLTFVETYFSLTETSAWVVSIDLDYSALMNCSNIMAELDWCSEFDTYITNLINATVDCNFIVWEVTWCTAFEDLVNSIVWSSLIDKYGTYRDSASGELKQSVIYNYWDKLGFGTNTIWWTELFKFYWSQINGIINVENTIESWIWIMLESWNWVVHMHTATWTSGNNTHSFVSNSDTWNWDLLRSNINWWWTPLTISRKWIIWIWNEWSINLANWADWDVLYEWNWRIRMSWNNLVFERYESGSWVQKWQFNS